jgi:hypothetical protein
MHHDQVQAWIAKCLTDPAFLRGMLHPSRTRGGSSTTPFDPVRDRLGEETLQQIERFSAFITKVKHNGLRRTIPKTMGLLAAEGLELTFFINFAPVYACERQKGSLPVGHHLDLFENALQLFVQQLPEKRRNQILETFDHEATIFRLPLSEQRLRGSLVTWKTPWQISQRQFAAPPPSPSPPCQPYFVLYTIGPTGQVLIRELNALTAYLFRSFFRAPTFSDIASDLSAAIGQPITREAVVQCAREGEDKGLFEITADVQR